MSAKGPLDGVRVVELAGLAPAPFATLLLADYGATILRVDRPHRLSHSTEMPPPTPDLLSRGKASIAIDLKSPGGLALVRKLLQHVDVLVDPFRPGVLEGLGLGPNTLLVSNPKLVVARLTGFRRDGKYADMAGHDINYLAVSGVLSQLGKKGDPPSPPANILADFAGGGLMCALGIIMALFGRQRHGRGQVVASNMVDGSAYLGSMMRLGVKTPWWNKPRGENLLDGGCPWYAVYQCKDGGYMAVGALEPQFFMELVIGLGLEKDLLAQRDDIEAWPSIWEKFRSTFMQKTRVQWENTFNGKDACCTPVLGQIELESAGYEQRHPISLTETPGLIIDQQKAWKDDGLPPGSGGEVILNQWLGWRRGQEYDVERGGLILASTAKL